MRERHWESVQRLFGFPVSPDKDLTLKRLIELEIIKRIDELRLITDNAAQEHEFEK